MHPAPKGPALGAIFFASTFRLLFVTARWLAHHPEDGFVNSQRFGFPLPRYPSYEVLTFTSVGLPPTEHISFPPYFSGCAGAEYPPHLSSVYASLNTSRYPTQDSRPSGSLLLSREALSSSASCRFSGKAMARTGLRMMPTFPSPPLKFRTAGFPRYGFKAGISDKAFPDNPGLPSSFVPTAFTLYSLPCVRDDARFRTPVRADPPPPPQGAPLPSGVFLPA